MKWKEERIKGKKEKENKISQMRRGRRKNKRQRRKEKRIKKESSKEWRRRRKKRQENEKAVNLFSSHRSCQCLLGPVLEEMRLTFSSFPVLQMVNCCWSLLSKNCFTDIRGVLVQPGTPLKSQQCERVTLTEHNTTRQLWFCSELRIILTGFFRD